ncbi:MAG: hypothetical protein O3A51_14125, partial [Verrucomicrobia bacterium]|nr:hypothetical protein [Verrucomicrobiota bacterium]
ARLYARSRVTRSFWDTLIALPGLARTYRQLRRECFQRPGAMTNRIGMTIDPPPGREAAELELLAELGALPVLLRFYHHEGAVGVARRIRLVQALRSAGHPVSIALVQDREAVNQPEAWVAFVNSVVDALHDTVEDVEVGHAVNRAKWGVWDYAELTTLYRPLADLSVRYPKLKIIGPAGIDFEYPFVLSALRQLPPGVRFDALSHHLYVDRRGAPEAYQFRLFSTLEKSVLGRAIARWSSRCGDRFTISEVNWPLLGTGVYSPVGSPYVSPGERFNDPSVDEDDYADYMIRFLCITLCSGMVDRVYWWRLVARGFGLVDDTDVECLRRRPAFQMLKTFIQQVGRSTFQCKRNEPNEPGVVCYRFNNEDGAGVDLLYAPATTVSIRVARGCDAFGNKLLATAVSLCGRPIYRFHD